ncbi:hypothetical protein [Microcoleus sp. D2_18a_B4]|uniref:hypothetical protein n=1 Tax=Microcoleus sp. D2_18a_B4 TaxID=3055329 RepID=UPI002FD3F7E9
MLNMLISRPQRRPNPISLTSRWSKISSSARKGDMCDRLSRQNCGNPELESVLYRKSPTLENFNTLLE